MFFESSAYGKFVERIGERVELAEGISRRRYFKAECTREVSWSRVTPAHPGSRPLDILTGEESAKSKEWNGGIWVWVW